MAVFFAKHVNTDRPPICSNGNIEWVHNAPYMYTTHNISNAFFLLLVIIPSCTTCFNMCTSKPENRGP